jgi:HD-like signal output (HDOD) protein
MMNSRITQEMENIALDRRALAKAFDDYLFVSNSGTRPIWSNVEETIYHQVSAHIENQDKFSKYVPCAPTLLIQLIDTLKSETADFKRIQEIIKADPGLTGQIIRISNSPLYRRRRDDITSIDKAITMLGFDEIMQVASAVMMKKVFHIESQRYRTPVSRVWKHCLKSAEACLFLAERRQEFRGYLLGLIHEIGRISILNCFIVECAGKNLDEIDDFLIIRRLMKEYGPWLSAFIAAEWGLDGHFLITFREFEKLCLGELTEEQYLHVSDDTKVLNLGSQCAMIHSLSSSNHLSKADGVAVLIDSGLSPELVEKIFTRFDLAEASLL